MSETMENKYQKKIITIPNLLSFFRLCLIPIMVWIYCVKKDYLWTTLILTLSGLTDVVDGTIARKCGMISDFGKILDPIADKLTQAAMLFCLVTRFPCMAIPLVLMVVKEVFASITGLLTIYKTKEVMGADWHGKATTVSIYALMVVHLIWYAIPDIFSHIFTGICVGIMLMSFILYGIRNLRVIRAKKQKGTYVVSG